MNAQNPGTNNDAVGRFDQEVPVNVRYETQLPDVAGWALNLGTVSDERFPKIKVDFGNTDLTQALQISILDLDVDDRFIVSNLSLAFYYDNLDVIIKGYTEQYVDQYQHTIEYNTAPYKPYNVAIFDNSGSRYGAINSTLAGALTSSATSFTVNVAANTGETWTIDAAQFPLDVLIGGERIRLSGISGTGPYTFTVAGGGRSINGVVKAHNAGDSVTVFTPVYYGR
jgi:hypothetical protein